MNVKPIQLTWDAIKIKFAAVDAAVFLYVDKTKYTNVFVVDPAQNELFVHRLELAGADRTDWTNNFEGAATLLTSEQLVEDEFFKHVRAKPVIAWGAFDTLGKSKGFPMEVLEVSGVRRLATTGELFGVDNSGDVWFHIGSQHDYSPITVGDTVRIQIAAGPNATLFPAIDDTYTVTAADMLALNIEEKVAEGIVNQLNTDVVFKVLWRARKIANNSSVWIGSKKVGSWSTRPNPGDFTIETTGTITVLLDQFHDRIITRNKSISLTRDTADPRLGIMGITGDVAASSEGIGQLFTQLMSINGDGTGAVEMAVNGSVTPVVFRLDADPNLDFFVAELRFFASANGIQYTNHLGGNNALTNGIEVTIRSEDALLTLPLIKTTEDYKNKFAILGAFSLDIVAGVDQALATFRPSSPFPIRRQGTFATNDYIQVRIQDNVATDAISLQMLIDGFKKEP